KWEPHFAPFTVKYDTDKREVSHLGWRFREPSGLPGGNYISGDENQRESVKCQVSGIPHEQFGLMRNHDSELQVAILVEDAALGLQEKSSTGIILLDIAKAFDTVWHEGIIWKLASLYNLPTSFVQPLDKLTDWTDTWKIKINAEKTQTLIITTKRTDKLRLITLHNENIAWSKSAKYLGILLYKKLTFTEHIKDKITKARAARAALHPFLKPKQQTYHQQETSPIQTNYSTTASLRRLSIHHDLQNQHK
ncbi:hypothetical protein YQE_00165, partial [Dendroctonus ponderosae]